MAQTTYHEAVALNATDLPVMLPSKLVGRDTVLSTVYNVLKQNKAVLIHGAAGVGKTAIAATLASAYTKQPGGSLWLTVDGDSLAQLIVRIGRAYGDMDIANSEAPTGKIGAVAALLAQNKPMIVLDGNPLMPAVTEFINKLAPNLPVIITSDTAHNGDWESVTVLPLEARDGAMLFAEKSGITTPEAGEVAALLNNEPLPLLVAAGTARVAKLDGAKLLGALKSVEAPNPAERALKVGYAGLQQALQGILLMLGATFEGKASLQLLSMLSGANTETVQKVMNILASQGFVMQDIRYGEPYYMLHPLSHAYAQSFLSNSGRLAALQDKVKDTTLLYAKQHIGNDTDDFNRLAVEMDAFLAVAHWSSEKGDHDPASQVVVAMTQSGNFVREKGYLYELLQLQEVGSSGMSAFPSNAELPPEALIPPAPEDDELYDTEVLGEDTDSVPSPEDLMTAAPVDPTNPDSLRTAIASERAKGNTAEALKYQTTLAALLKLNGNENEALVVYNEMLAAYEDADDKPNIMTTRLALAEIMVKQDSSQAVIHHATQGVTLAKELKSDAAHMQFLLYLGDARQQLGESTEAILAYSHALDLARGRNDRDTEATALMQLGFAQLDDDDPEIAIQTWDTALKLCRELGKRDCEARIMGGLGTAYGELNRWEEATSFHKSALHTARAVQDKKEESLQLSNLGYAAKQANKLGESLLYYRQALHLAYTLNERDNIVSTLVDLARLLVESPLHLDIADMLINDALVHDPGDRDVLKLKERISNEKIMAAAQQVEFRPVKGTAQDYAQAAYQLLEE